MSLFNIVKINGSWDAVKRVKVVDYQELMENLCSNRYRFSDFLTQCIKDVQGNFYEVRDHDGHKLDRAMLHQMMNDYRSFTGALPRETEADIGDKFRTAPVPHTGKNYTTRGRYTTRSREVKRFGYLQLVDRSDRRNNSWKNTSKARKSWAKHMPVNGRQTQNHFKRLQLEDDLELWESMLMDEFMEYCEREEAAEEMKRAELTYELDKFNDFYEWVATQHDSV